MPRLLPSIEVRPLGGLVWYGLVIAVVLGALFAGGVGGAAVWVGFWLVVLVIAYLVISKLWGSVS